MSNIIRKILGAAGFFLLGGAALIGVLAILPTMPAKDSNTTITILDKSQVPVNTTVPLMGQKKTVRELKIKASRTLNLEGEMGSNAVTIADQIQDLNNIDNKEPIYLLITSPGGSVLAGAVLLSAIEASQAPVYTICKAMCASMAAITLQYGKKRYVTDRTILMYHPAAMGSDGDVDRIYEEVSAIKRYVNKMELQISQRMHLSFDDYKTLSGRQIWIDSEDAFQRQFVDEIVSLNVEMDKSAIPFIIEQSAPNRNKLFELPKKEVAPMKRTNNILENVRWEN